MKNNTSGRRKLSLMVAIAFIFTLSLGMGQIATLASASSPAPVSLDTASKNWELTQGYTDAVDKTGVTEFTGGTAYNDRITYKNDVDVSAEVSFDIKFIEQALANGSSFVGLTLGKDNDSFNNNSKGLTFLLYKKSDGAIECAQNPGPWWEFPFAETNTIKIKKGAAGWELYFKNSTFTTDKLIATVPFTAVAADTFTNNKAKLSIVTSDSKSNPIKFQVSNLVNAVTANDNNTGNTDDKGNKGNTDITQVLPYMDKTYVLPTNDSYWQCGQNTTYKDGILTIGDAGSGLYTGSNLVNRVAQFKMSATIPSGKWVGYLLRQTNPGSAPWDQKNAYLVIIRSDGGVEVNKYIDKANTVIATGTTTAFQTPSIKTVRIGAVDEGDSVRLIFDIDGKTVINYLDNNNPVKTHGNFSILTLETANVKIYTGPAGTDKDNSGDIDLGQAGNSQPVLSADINGIGMGYTGGPIVKGMIDRPEITDDLDLDKITDTAIKNKK